MEATLAKPRKHLKPRHLYRPELKPKKKKKKKVKAKKEDEGFKLHPKQREALDLLTDNYTKFIGYGGAAGGGKSYLGCYWLNLMCEMLPGSKWFIGRDSLKDTRESVLFTFRKVSKELKRKNWTYKDNHITFKNGSEIEFLDLSFYPQKDPLYERYGSKEYTGGWIEEAGPINVLAFDVLKTRINRWYNKEYNITGKILVTFNPKRNWVYNLFYKPWKKNQEVPKTVFIRALATDNPSLDDDYIENLNNISDKNTKQRLLYGNFEYDDDPCSLIGKKTIDSVFTNDHILRDYRRKRIICDVARYGSDRAIIAVFYGRVMVEYYILDKSATTEITKIIQTLRIKHKIPLRHIAIDQDGVGGGVVDQLNGVMGNEVVDYKNGGKPMGRQAKNYYNLKSQCGYKFADTVSETYIECTLPESEMESIKEEFAMLKTYEMDKDGKLRTMPKEKIKELLGRSPDWLDIFLMLQVFEFQMYSMR